MDPHRQQAAWDLSLSVVARRTPSAGCRTAVVILVGVTAGRKQRRHLKSFFAARAGFDVFLPYLPYALGLRACSVWCAAYLRRHVLNRGYLAIHFLNFIGGGYVFRSLGQTLADQSPGRVVYVRSPIQEQIPQLLAKHYTRLGLMFLGGKMMADLSSEWIRSLPFPSAGAEKGLMLEMGISRMAASLGLEISSLPPAAWSVAELLPGADDVLEVMASHDEIYESDDALAQVATFFDSGKFNHDQPQFAGQAAMVHRSVHAP